MSDELEATIRSKAEFFQAGIYPEVLMSSRIDLPHLKGKRVGIAVILLEDS